MMKVCAVWIWLVLLLCLMSGCATVDLVTGRQTRNFFKVEDDIEMGRSGLRDFKKAMRESRVPINRDAAQLARLNEITRRIVTANDLTQFPFEVTLFETNIVNAMAMPGGQLLAFPGLWDGKTGLVQDTDELAAVFSHEIAHVVCRHSTEQLTRELPIQLLLGGAAVYAELKEDEDMSKIVTGAFVLYQGLLVPKYSRTDETEADLVGMIYMARAGFDPRAAVRLWKRMDEKSGGEWAALSIFSTHPTHKRRYEDLEKALPDALVEYEKAKAEYPAMTAGVAPDAWQPAMRPAARRGLFRPVR